MRRSSARRFSRATLVVAGIGVVLAGGAGLTVALADNNGIGAALIGGGCLVAVGALWILDDVLMRHFRALERLRGLAVAMRSADGRCEATLEEADSEAAALSEELLGAIAIRARDHAAPDDRLTAVLASVQDAVIAVTDQGQISLVNGPAKALLGHQRVTVGTSIYDALQREALAEALARARAAGAPVAARLVTVAGGDLDGTVSDMGRYRGFTLCIPVTAAPAFHAVEHDLSLHDRPPQAAPPGPATPLAELPLTVVDSETTGLDPRRDRIVAIGAVRLHGARLYRAVSLDLLVNPGAPIPPTSTLIHGITDAMVADAPPWRDQVQRLLAISAGTVVIGHNIGFDLAMFRAEAVRAGLAWSDPPALDTVQLAAMLEPDETEFDLEAIAARHGVSVQGRHTALGDCLIAAAIWQRLIPRLAGRGIVTFGAAQAFAARAERILSRQRAAGW